MQSRIGLTALIILTLFTAPASAADYWVDAVAGNDTNPGTELLPFATITYAIATGGAGATITVLPGTYDAALGEVFPITLLTDQTVVGDVPTKGGGATPTSIVGKGTYGGLSGVGSIATVVCGPSSTISGFQIDADSHALSHAGVVIHGVLAHVNSNTIMNTTYAGVYMNDAKASQVVGNQFDTSSYGVYLNASPDTPVIGTNVFASPSLSINMTGVDSDPWIDNNTFQSGSIVCVQVSSGYPRISGNTFEAGSGATYGAVRTRNLTAAPILRSNIFQNSLAVQIQRDGFPDLGASGDPGNNDFTGVTGVCIQHDGTTDINAIGNTWPNDPPVDGVDIIINGTGSVILFTVPVDASSVGRMKGAY